MHKFRATYLGAIILGWLLAFGVGPAAAYYSPLPATATFTSNSVSRTVYDPKLQKTYGYTIYFWGDVEVIDLIQDNGVIAWLKRRGATYDVTCSVYDPGAGTYITDILGPFPWVEPMVSHFQVVDGVVAFSIIDSSGNAGARYATYDPAKGAWQKGVFSEPGAATMELYCKDGVVVYRFLDSGGGDNFKATIYEPQWGKWSSPSYHGYSGIYGYVYISNATVYYYTQAFGQDFTGYCCGGWDRITTVPFAYFVAQPKLGSSPLWVWFTDMSIAGANWSWVFGDNFFGIGRSPYHTFTSPGNFQVTQWISGPSTYSQTITVKRNSLPGMLHLLLLAD